MSEVIVADQCPAHSREVMMRLQKLQTFPRLHYLTLERAGLPIARNAILATAKTEFLVFLDDDVILPNGFFDSYLQTFIETGANIIQDQVIQLYNLDDFDQPAELLRKRGCPQFGEVSMWMKDWSFFIGANHAIRRSRALQVGGYDEQLGCGAAKNEEADFINRTTQSPTDVYYGSNCWLVHYSAPTGGIRQHPYPCLASGKSHIPTYFCVSATATISASPANSFGKPSAAGPFAKTTSAAFGASHGLGCPSRLPPSGPSSTATKSLTLPLTAPLEHSAILTVLSVFLLPFHDTILLSQRKHSHE